MSPKFVIFICFMLLLAGPASAGIFGGSSHEHDQQPHQHRDGIIKTALKGAAVGAVSSVAYRAISGKK